MPHLTSWHQQGQQHLHPAIYHMSQGCSLGSSSTGLQHKQGSAGSFWTDPHTHELIPQTLLSIFLTFSSLSCCLNSSSSSESHSGNWYTLMPNLSISSRICVHARQNQKNAKLNNKEMQGLFCLCYHWLAIAYRWQKDFLLQSASLLTQTHCTDT